MDLPDHAVDALREFPEFVLRGDRNAGREVAGVAGGSRTRSFSVSVARTILRATTNLVRTRRATARRLTVMLTLLQNRALATAARLSESTVSCVEKSRRSVTCLTAWN